MRSRYLKALLPVLSLTAMGYADMTANVDMKDQPHFIQYHNRMSVFNPIYQSYDRTENDAFYVGIRGYVSPVWSKWHRHKQNYIFDSEFRMGYNYFYNGRDHVTPYAGVGYVQDFTRHTGHNHRTRHNQGIVYGGLGLIYDHEFTHYFTWGVDAQFVIGGAVTGDNHNHNHHRWGTPVVGCNVSMPFTFRFGHMKHWDIRIEPFDIYLHGSHRSHNYFGFRNSIGYRF